MLKYPGHERISQIEELSRITREGCPLESYYGYKMDGFFQSYEEIEASAIPVGGKGQPGDVKFVDRNEDGVIDSKDKFILGNAFPRLTFGFNYNVEWKGFDFGMFWQGVGKRDMMLRGELIEPFHANYSYNIYKHQHRCTLAETYCSGFYFQQKQLRKRTRFRPILDGWKIPASEELADWLHIP